MADVRLFPGAVADELDLERDEPFEQDEAGAVEDKQPCMTADDVCSLHHSLR